MSKQQFYIFEYIKANTATAIIIGAGVVASLAIAGALAFSGDNQPVSVTAPAINKAAQKNENRKDIKIDASAESTTNNASTEPTQQQNTAPSSRVTGNVAVITPANIGSSTINQAPVSGNNQNVITTRQPVTTVVNSSAGNTGNNGSAPIKPTVPPVVVTPPVIIPSTSFDKARVSLTFDDGWKSIATNGLPMLKSHGLVSTQYVNSQPTTDGYTGYMTYEEIASFTAVNHEIGWHTNTHTYDLTAATVAQRQAELTPNPAFIMQLLTRGVTLSDNFAAPFGTQSTKSAAAVKTAGFNSYRSTDDGYNTKTTTDATHTKLDVNNIKVKNVCGIAGIEACGDIATTPEEVSTWIADAKINNAWLVIVFHEVGEFSRATAMANGTTCDADVTEVGVLPDNCVVDPSYAVTPANFNAMLTNVKNSGVTVQTVNQALAELNAQL